MKQDLAWPEPYPFSQELYYANAMWKGPFLAPGSYPLTISNTYALTCLCTFALARSHFGNISDHPTHLPSFYSSFKIQSHVPPPLESPPGLPPHFP